MPHTSQRGPRLHPLSACPGPPGVQAHAAQRRAHCWQRPGGPAPPNTTVAQTRGRKPLPTSENELQPRTNEKLIHPRERTAHWAGPQLWPGPADSQHTGCLQLRAKCPPALAGWLWGEGAVPCMGRLQVRFPEYISGMQVQFLGDHQPMSLPHIEASKTIKKNISWGRIKKEKKNGYCTVNILLDLQQLKHLEIRPRAGLHGCGKVADAG